jgi:hypothetical protein
MEQIMSAALFFIPFFSLEERKRISRTTSGSLQSREQQHTA